MSSLAQTVPAKLSPAPMSTALATSAVQRVMREVDTKPEVQDLYRQGPELRKHYEAILMANHLNDDGFEHLAKSSQEEIVPELRRRPPTRWIGKAAPPQPTPRQAPTCPSLRPG